MASRWRRFLISMIIAGVTAPLSSCENGSLPTHESVTIRGHEFNLELALDEASREQGLMHRESIPEHGGMLFVFPDSEVRSFWMGHCLVDIDIIFLDPLGRITAMHTMKAEPPQGEDETDIAYRARLRDYSSFQRAQFCIELQAGWLERLQLKRGEKLNVDVDRLKDLVRRVDESETPEAF